MNVFQTHSRIVHDYATYIGSFLNIADPNIREVVESELSQGKLWPEPLLQFNPAFEMAGNVADLCQSGVLHPDIADIYNLFHSRDLSPAKVAKVSKKPQGEAERGYQGLLELRHLHRDLNLTVRDAYDWQDLDLGHNFHEVETLPENDRVRYTLRRLLALNHERAAAAVAMTSAESKPSRRKARTSDAEGDLFA